jgi:RND superfamily putative drug exporter
VRGFYGLGVFAYRFRWAVLAVWAAILIASAFFAPNLSERLKGGGFEGSNSEAEKVQNVMSDEFGVSPAALTVVFTGDGLEAKGQEFQDAQEEALAEVRKMDKVRYVASYAGSEDGRFISRDGRSPTRLSPSASRSTRPETWWRR